MEAARVGAREADLAPAPDPTGGRSAGCTAGRGGWYASFASVTNSTFGRPMIPVFPLHR